MMDPLLLGAHVGNHRLRREKHRAQIHFHAVIPIFGRHIFNGMTLIIRRIINENLDRPELVTDLSDRLA